MPETVLRRTFVCKRKKLTKIVKIRVFIVAGKILFLIKNIRVC